MYECGSATYYAACFAHVEDEVARPIRRPRLYLILTAVSAALTLYGGFQLIGTPLRRTHILNIFTGGMVAGVSLSQGLMAYRALREKEKVES